MKELSIEEKAKAYDIAFDKIKMLLGTSNSCSREELEYVFPELKESEDERIRKALINGVECCKASGWTNFGNNVDIDVVLDWLEKQGKKVEPIEGFSSEFERQISQLIASIINKEYEYTEAFVKWTSDAFLNYAKRELEKQGEQKLVVTPKFRVGDFVKDANYHGEPIYKIVGIDNKCYICEYRGNKSMGDKRVMHFTFDNPYLHLVQNPVEWSEKDENMLNSIIDEVMPVGECPDYPNEEERKYYYDGQEKVDWLKSLKERYTWKPSDEQMDNK